MFARFLDFVGVVIISAVVILDFVGVIISAVVIFDFVGIVIISAVVILDFLFIIVGIPGVTGFLDFLFIITGATGRFRFLRGTCRRRIRVIVSTGAHGGPVRWSGRTAPATSTCSQDECRQSQYDYQNAVSKSH